jgi:deoxycytidine triphosphate deaminase
MILTGTEIVRQHNADRITIDPFDVDQVNPNSYDFRLVASSRVVYGSDLISGTGVS